MSRHKRSVGGPPTPKPGRPPRAQPAALTILHPNAAGIDVHSDMHMVCVPAEGVAPTGEPSPGGLPANVRRFGANYRMLKYGKEYVRQSMEEYEQKVRKQLERSLLRKAAALGFELIAKPPLSSQPTTKPALT